MAGFLLIILLFALLLADMLQKEGKEPLDFRGVEVKNLMLYAPYIEGMKGSKSIDYSQVEKAVFSSYTDYQEYGFITDEQVNESSYENYEVAVVGDTHGSMGAANYAVLLVHKETRIPCGYAMLK